MRIVAQAYVARVPRDRGDELHFHVAHRARWSRRLRATALAHREPHRLPCHGCYPSLLPRAFAAAAPKFRPHEIKAALLGGVGT